MSTKALPRDEPPALVEAMMRAAIAGADPAAAVTARAPHELRGRDVRVVGAGKAVAGMLRGLVEGCDCRVPGGVIVGPAGTVGAVRAAGVGSGVEVHEADHP